MALEFGTMGISLKYAIETSAGSKPATFTEIPDVVTIPALNDEPNNLDVTNLADLVWRRSIPGLRNTPGTIPITVNGTKDFKSKWTAMVSSAATALASSKATWFEFNVPGYSSGFFFTGIPEDLGFFGADVDEVYRGDVYITPNTISGWGAAI